MKVCRKCNVEKPESLFYRISASSQKTDSKCKECAKEYTRKWKRENPGYHRKNLLEKQYGITTEDYDNLRRKQGYCCAICKRPEIENQHKQLDIDHCHTNGHVRGLLCAWCNTGIGLLQENPDILLSAIDYIKDNEK